MKTVWEICALFGQLLLLVCMWIAFCYNLGICLGICLIWMPLIICRGRSKVENLCLRLFCILLCSELSPQVDASWISAITHSPFSGTSESFIKPPTGHLYVDVLQLPKRVMFETELIFCLIPPTQLLFIQCGTFSLIILSFTQVI